MSLILEPILAELDYRIVAIVVVVMLIAGIIALVKKIVKTGLIVIVLALLVSVSGPAAYNFQQSYGMHVENGAIHLKIEGVDHTIDKKNCTEIKLERQDMVTYKAKIQYINETKTLTVPTFMVTKIVNFAEKHDIPVERVD